MNKFVTVVGVAAVVTLAGCKDPDYKRVSDKSQNEVKTVAAEPMPAPAPVAKPTVAEEKRCTCRPGAKHKTPCMCGANDCACIVEVKPLPPPEPVTTTYIVQNGDYLAKISKKFNVTISSIKSLNRMKSDVVRVGQKLKLPGVIDVGVQSAPAKTASTKSVKKSAPSAKAAKGPYKGETKEYVVKSGDTLGAIAYGNGCTIRQLKELNGLKKNALRIGQKLKVPANGAVAKNVKKDAAKTEGDATAPKASDASVAPATTAPAEAAPAEAAPAEAAPATTAEPAAADAAAPAAPVPEPVPTTTYTVQEGDDLTGVAVRWGTSASAIKELNNLSDDAQLKPGQVIKLPADAQQ